MALLFQKTSLSGSLWSEVEGLYTKTAVSEAYSPHASPEKYEPMNQSRVQHAGWPPREEQRPHMPYMDGLPEWHNDHTCNTLTGLPERHKHYTCTWNALPGLPEWQKDHTCNTLTGLPERSNYHTCNALTGLLEWSNDHTCNALASLPERNNDHTCNTLAGLPDWHNDHTWQAYQTGTTTTHATHGRPPRLAQRPHMQFSDWPPREEQRPHMQCSG